jgi:large conductance mechanosensitive channel
MVSDIILPIISLLPFISRNIEEKFVLLRRGPNAVYQVYNTTEQAIADGAVIWMYGSFLDKLMRFILIALSLFIIGKAYGYLADDNIIKRTVRCKFCRKFIAEKAKRCFNCTSWQDGREDAGR